MTTSKELQKFIQFFSFLVAIFIEKNAVEPFLMYEFWVFSHSKSCLTVHPLLLKIRRDESPPFMTQFHFFLSYKRDVIIESISLLIILPMAII